MFSFLQSRTGFAAECQCESGIGNGSCRSVKSQAAVSGSARRSAIGHQRIVHRPECIKSAGCIWKVLLFGPLRGMFPLLVGSVNLTGEEVDVSSQDLHHKTGGLRGVPLRFLFPVRVTGLEMMEEDVAVIVGSAASTLLERFVHIPFDFLYAVDCQ